MSEKRLDFLVFYRGNMVKGFEYIYAKRHEGHAFLQLDKNSKSPKNINDLDYDFFNPHYNQSGEPFQWHYNEEWVDLSTRWDDLAPQILAYIDTWMTEYPGPSYPDKSLNDEWGVRFKLPGQREQIIWGLNAFPSNLQNFKDLLSSYSNSASQ